MNEQELKERCKKLEEEIQKYKSGMEVNLKKVFCVSQGAQRRSTRDIVQGKNLEWFGDGEFLVFREKQGEPSQGNPWISEGKVSQLSSLCKTAQFVSQCGDWQKMRLLSKMHKFFSIETRNGDVVASFKSQDDISTCKIGISQQEIARLEFPIVGIPTLEPQGFAVCEFGGKKILVWKFDEAMFGVVTNSLAI